MQVSNTDNFDVVFTFVSHPYFGVVLEANAVLLLPNGNYSLTYQRIRPQNTAYYNLNTEQAEVVRLIDGFEVAEVMKKFYTGKKLRAADWFAKHYTPDMHKLVRDYIEKRLIQVIPVVKNYPMYWSGDTGNVIHSKIAYTEEPASVLFHFRRDELGTNYFATIKHQDRKVEFYQNNSELLIESPAWLLTPTHLLHFSKFTDGKKIRPFLQRKFIHVEPKQEGVYMDKFVAPLLENHDVFAVGFDIVTEQFPAKPLIRLQKLDEQYYLSLSFRYGEWTFPYSSAKRVNVRLENDKGAYTFHRIRRSHNQEQEIMGFLKQFGIRNYSGSLFSLENTENPLGLIEWINENNDELERAGFEVTQEPTQGAAKLFLGKIALELKVNQESDWFDLHAIVKFGNYEIPFIRLKNNILKNQREFILPNGEVAILPLEWFQRFGKIAHMASEEGETLRLKNMHFSLLSDLGEYLDFSMEDQEAWKERLANNKIPVLDIPSGMNVELRNYQKEGYEWILFLMKLGIGPLLADDMGLGKTIQTLAVLQQLKNEGSTVEEALFQSAEPRGLVSTGGQLLASRVPVFEAGSSVASPEPVVHGVPVSNRPAKKEKTPFLIITPKSLLYNWQTETNKFAPGMKVLIYSGLNRGRLLARLHNYDVVITSYGTMRIDIEKFSRMKFTCIVLDESQAIKNPASQTAKALQQLSSSYRLALTGTPIENSLMDIWSQMNFLNPGLLGTYSYFEKTYIRPIEKSRDTRLMRELRQLLDPFILRRTKKQVATELPEKIEKVHYCEMSPEQAEVYETTRNQYRNEILATVRTEGLSRSRLRIFNGLMHLRQLALNPVLKNAEYNFSSGKDDEIKRMLLRAVEGGHKVLLFSQFVSYLRIFTEMLSNLGIPFCYLDGSLDEKERQTQIMKFQETKEVKVFLLSLRAGNSGINLTAADYVFLADPWWNPFTMKQAEDRAHRIGQEKAVFSYKFITKDTIEEKILKLQERKTRLAGSIIPDEDSLLSSLDMDELQELLE